MKKLLSLSLFLLFINIGFTQSHTFVISPKKPLYSLITDSTTNKLGMGFTKRRPSLRNRDISINTNKRSIDNDANSSPHNLFVAQTAYTKAITSKITHSSPAFLGSAGKKSAFTSSPLTERRLRNSILSQRHNRSEKPLTSSLLRPVQ